MRLDLVALRLRNRRRIFDLTGTRYGRGRRGRFIAATGPLMLGFLTTSVFAYAKDEGQGMPFRYAGLTMCSVFILGLVVLPFLPETKDKPLPE